MIDRKTMLTQAIENGFEKTSEGYPDTLKYCKEKNAYDYTIYGNCGKNLFDVNQKMRFRYPSLQTSTIDGDTLTVSNKAYATGGMWCNIPVKAGTYTLSVGSTTNNIYINYFAEPVNTWNFNTMTVGAHVIGSNTKPPVSLPIEATADGYIVVFALFTSASDDNTVTTSVYTNIQVELGETATEYESYKAVGDKAKNLLQYPYANTTSTRYGVTFTDNGDGSITVSGTATNSVYFRFSSHIPVNKWDTFTLRANSQDKANMRIGISRYKSDSNSSLIQEYSTSEDVYTYTVKDDETKYIDVFMKRDKDGAECAGTFKPELLKGKYEIPIKISGKNMFDVTTSYTNYANEDGGITFSNTDFSAIYNLSINGFENNTVYSISGKYEVTNADNNSVFIGVYYTDGTNEFFRNCYGGVITGDKSGNFSVQTISNKSIDSIKLALYSTSARMYNIKLSNIQIEKGSSATAYEPYTEPCTTTIYRSDRLKPGESINYENDNLPPLPLFNDTNVITAETEVPPSNISVTYNTKVRGSHE